MPDFPDKVTIPCLNTLSPNYWLSGMTRLSLDLVTDSVIQTALAVSRLQLQAATPFQSSDQLTVLGGCQSPPAAQHLEQPQLELGRLSTLGVDVKLTAALNDLCTGPPTRGIPGETFYYVLQP